ncbi:hypothetical protein CANARDRAFT_26326 [[Candida] arabinofermentans NRRL YB-2248]|uniref:BTB domain-containing protein n=1 Tax=[Candida] arabinofermentans NRRL YB-2248 TaxID=983967 RepID=A0A1E4T8X4_9ASCO|nr:hypothetical protein CANARDRAFT_26326 [[Candida] arabinofermentans NRRL YB-2248]
MSDEALPFQAKQSTYSVDHIIPEILPHEKMYSIQIGDKLYRLSGASLSSDGPSYFTKFFSESDQQSKVLFIDRSPQVFHKIYMHLQGYSIKIEGSHEFMHLYADANYFELSKLRGILLKDAIHAIIGGKSFDIPKELITTDGNYPNYFTVAYNATLRNPFTVNELKGLIRPPPMAPYIINRSPNAFADILESLYGGKIQIRDENHRDSLLAECRYYRFFALEQQLINHKISMNPFTREEEITINLKNMKKAGLSHNIIGNNDFTPIKYARPYIDKKHRNLIMELACSEMSLLINRKTQFLSLSLVGDSAKKLNTILSVVTSDLMYEEQIDANGKRMPKLTMLINISQSYTMINGIEMSKDWYKIFFENDNGADPPSSESIAITPVESYSASVRSLTGDVVEAKILKSQWIVNVDGTGKIYMNAVALDGVLDQASYNKKRGFL